MVQHAATASVFNLWLKSLKPWVGEISIFSETILLKEWDRQGQEFFEWSLSQGFEVDMALSLIFWVDTNIWDESVDQRSNEPMIQPHPHSEPMNQ